MRLVDREERDLAAVEQVRVDVEPQPLGREVEQVELARQEPASTTRRSSKSCVEFRNAARTPSAAQRVDLVLHQRDQRRDDDARAGS